jgi:hypothetical protein
MSSNFLGQWGYTNGILREDHSVHDFDYSPHPGSFGDSRSHWLFQGDLFGLNGHSSFGFDLAEASYKHADPEPMSPSSVATTPTTSEQPLMTHSSMVIDRDAHIVTSDDMDDVEFELPQNLPKKIRRSLTVPSTASYADRNGRKKKYDAPPGVWRNSGGFISTVYINKKRVYGPLRRDVSDAVKDREEMLVAKSVIETEEGMRAFVQAMKERSGPSRNSVSLTEAIESAMMMAHMYSRGAQSVTTNSLSSRQVKRNSSLPFFDDSMKEEIKDEDVKDEDVPAFTSVRVSSRPVRAAAKRNIYLSGCSEEVIDQFEANPDYVSAGLFDTL